ncbi:MAG: TIGR01777 family oxidoreductase [Bryobacteraceae bacterium]
MGIVNYLITGASGFVGRKLVHILLSENHSVDYLRRKRSTSLDSRAAFHAWNSGERPPLSSIPPVGAIVHLAGEPVAQRWTPEVKQRIYASRVESTRQLVSAIGELRHKPAVLVTASAVGYYGDRGDEVLTESSAPGADFLAKLCFDWEREATRAHEFGVRVVRIRIGIVLGRGGGALKQMMTPFRLGMGGRLGRGGQWMPWIHVDDLVRLFVHTAEHPSIDGPLNGGSPEPVTNLEFTRSLAHALHRPAILPIPKFALKFALGEFADYMFASLRVMPEATKQSGFEFTYPQLSGALNTLL